MNVVADTAASRPTIQTRRSLNTSLWVAQVVLALVFGASGALKLAMSAAAIAKNAPWAADATWVIRFIGISEIAGALGMLLPSLTRIRPRLTPLAGIGLLTIMVLASCFHILHGPPSALIVTISLGALAAFVAWGRSRGAPIAARKPSSFRQLSRQAS